MTLVDNRGVIRSAADALQVLMRTPRWNPLPHQMPPDGDWYGWLLLAGRGAGKTAACANYMVQHASGPPCLPGRIPHWMGIIAPTLGDAATSCMYGPSGISAQNPDVRLHISPGGTILKWPNGSEAKLFGASNREDVERLRSGGNRCLIWGEELAAWRYLDECWDHMRLGLRSGPRPHWIASTTPKPRPLIKSLKAGTVQRVVVSHASTDQNPHLPESFRQDLYDTYSGTQLGDQELRGLILDEDRNALWTRASIASNRIDYMDAPDFTRICVAVDPSGGAGEQGIVVGASWSRHERNEVTGQLRRLVDGYVLDDRTCHLDPNGWGKRAVQAAIDWDATDIVVETNFGGDMAVSTIIEAANGMGIRIPVKKITASRGKHARAEPVAALSEQGRWHHVGIHEELETQLTTWTPESPDSPDRLDAMVWTAWHNKVVGNVLSMGSSFSGSTFANARIGQ